MTDELMSEIKAPKTDGSIIMVVGVGGAGGNAVNHMWNLGIRGVTFMVCNCLLYTSPSPRDRG